MRLIRVSSNVIDTQTGEINDRLDIERLLTSEPGGVIAGYNLYGVLVSLIPEIRKDEGWTMSIHAQRQRVNPLTENEKRVKGVIYISRLTYRRPKYRAGKKRRRPPAIKWVVLNLELFCDQLQNPDVLATAKSLIALADRRGIKPKHSPGAMGSAMLRASPEWKGEKRRPAPFFISKIAREYLPGNFYAINERKDKGVIPHCYYLDQQSSHHKITDSIPLPHPHYLRARGRLRAVEEGKHPLWIDAKEMGLLHHQVGLLCCYVESGVIPAQLTHLYPQWALKHGKHVRWIWTPELKLLDRFVRIRHVCAALTSHRIDPALWEYSDWSIEQLQREDAKVFKSSLLAAYGMLGIKQDGPLELYTVHGRQKPPRAELCELPLIKGVYRSTVIRSRVPTIQNVIARGVIEAETRTRSLLFARQLEDEGIPVMQIYADGLLAATDQLSLTLPEHWRVVASLTRVHSPHPNSFISDQLVRLPGVQHSQREAYLRRTPATGVDEADRVPFPERESFSLRQHEPRESLGNF